MHTIVKDLCDRDIISHVLYMQSAVNSINFNYIPKATTASDIVMPYLTLVCLVNKAGRENHTARNQQSYQLQRRVYN